MKPKDHANLLGIFAWIMSGWQLLLTLFFGLYVLIMGGVAAGMFLDPKVNDPGGPIIMGVMATIFGVFTLIGLAGSVSNFLLGKRLRSEFPPTKRFVITACIINFASFCTGGIFAAALGASTEFFIAKAPKYSGSAACAAASARTASAFCGFSNAINRARICFPYMISYSRTISSRATCVLEPASFRSAKVGQMISSAY